MCTVLSVYDIFAVSRRQNHRVRSVRPASAALRDPVHGGQGGLRGSSYRVSRGRCTLVLQGGENAKEAEEERGRGKTETYALPTATELNSGRGGGGRT